MAGWTRWERGMEDSSVPPLVQTNYRKDNGDDSEVPEVQYIPEETKVKSERTHDDD